MQVENEKRMEMLGKRLGRALAPGDLVYLSGELGAGKTTLARGIARGLGYEGRVNSPTFTLMNVYQGRCPIYHFDFYRLSEEELDDLGLEDYLGGEGICLIEWPAAGEKALPRAAWRVDIALVENDYELPRQVTVRGPAAADKTIWEGMRDIVDSGH